MRQYIIKKGQTVFITKAKNPNTFYTDGWQEFIVEKDVIYTDSDMVNDDSSILNHQDKWFEFNLPLNKRGFKRLAVGKTWVKVNNE